MNKHYHIKKAEDYISASKKIVDDTTSSEDEKAYASLSLRTGESWLAFLKSGRNDSAGAEAIIEEVYNRDNKPSGVWLSSENWFFVSPLFKDLYKWISERGLVTENIKRWKNELFTREADFIYGYYEGWQSEPPDVHVRVVASIVKKWINIINAGTITQQNIDDLMHPFLGWQSVSGSMFWTVAYEIRDWAEMEGFRVVSKKRLDKHWKDVWNNFVKQIKSVNQK